MNVENGWISPDTAGRAEKSRFIYLIQNINDAVVEFEISNGEPVVLSVNQAFVEVFGIDRSDAIGESLNDLIVPEWRLDEASRLDEQTATGEVNHQQVKRQAADGLGEFLYRGVPYEVTEDRTRGLAIYTDITEIRRRGRRLQVLSRLFRHNMRNKLTIISGLTETIERNHRDHELVGETVTQLRESVQSLHGLAEEAEEINKTLRDLSPDVTVDCVRAVEAVVARHRSEYPRAMIETDLPEPQLLVKAGQCEKAIAQLVDNAISHNPAETPYVRVCLSEVAVGDWVDILVEDDGPTIPEAERAVLTGDQEIDQIMHGSGLGLWLVKWTVEKAGGQLSFEERAGGGNRVRLRLPTGDEMS